MCALTQSSIQQRPKLFLTLTNKKTSETKQTSRIIFDRPVISQNSKVALMYANKRSKLVYSENHSVSSWLKSPLALFLSLLLSRAPIVYTWTHWTAPPVLQWVCIILWVVHPKCTTMNNQYSRSLAFVLYLTPYRKYFIISLIFSVLFITMLF